MVWRSLVISRPTRLRREHFSLAVEQEATAFVPFEDIAVVVLDHRDITLTHAVLAACAEYGIGLYVTGQNHQPAGVFLPYLSHSRTTRLLRQQLALSRPLAKQAWAALVRRKIENQATCLHLAGREGTDRLESLARRVRSGDAENLEGQASAFYFPRLFGHGFQRSDQMAAGRINALLNYGYAILRGAITRAIVAHGLHPPLGLFHASEQNAFNLADDLIEPFRPLVDLHVFQHTRISSNGAQETEFTPTDKAALIALLHVDIALPQGSMSVLNAIEYGVESLVRLLENSEMLLELPRLTGLQPHPPEV
ncbi:MAG: type II CRISPR-associated endonuclease Cas1 [Sterolibacterium sp.]|nr:type II CRISPR-associated endonuclease Cas1 [Sterolibacterium sp.]